MDAAARWERVWDVPLVVAALATIPLLVLRYHPPAPAWRTVAEIGDWLVWAVFAVEVGVMLVVLPSRWSWVRSHPIDVAIVVLTLPVLSTSLQGLRLLRVLRVLPMVRLAPSARRVFSLTGLRWMTFLALVALLAGGEAFAAAENLPLGDGIYWAVSTMTTVGYGDFVPHSTGAKVVACLVMLVGVGFFAMITGAIAQRFLAVEVETVEEEVEAVQETVEQIERTESREWGIQPQVASEIRDIAARLAALERRLSSQAEP